MIHNCESLRSHL